jgi:hypothetical protein
MAKILWVLYDDPITGYPKSYPRNDPPEIKSYFGGQSGDRRVADFISTASSQPVQIHLCLELEAQR